MNILNQSFHIFTVIQGRFLFFTKPLTRAEYMSSGVLYSAGYFKGSCCLRFHYHMRSGGYLRIFTKEAVSKKKNPYVLIWEKEGPQGNRWNVMEKSISGVMIKVRWFDALLCHFHLCLRCQGSFPGIPGLPTDKSNSIHTLMFNRIKIHLCIGSLITAHFSKVSSELIQSDNDMFQCLLDH